MALCSVSEPEQLGQLGGGTTMQCSQAHCRLRAMAQSLTVADVAWLYRSFELLLLLHTAAHNKTQSVEVPKQELG
jgi:hypothetical protein